MGRTVMRFRFTNIKLAKCSVYVGHLLRPFKITAYMWRIRKMLLKVLGYLKVPLTFENVYGAKMIVEKGVGGEYFVSDDEVGMLGVLDEFLGEGDVFVDVGAYVGFLSMYASWRVGERGKVLAFEPNPLAYRVLLKNLRMNAIKNVIAMDVALGSREEYRYLSMYDNRPASETTLMDTGQSGKRFRVRIRRLDDVLSDLRIGKVRMVKIDVEGWENEVLKGMVETIERSSPILIVEKGPLFLGGYLYLLDRGYRPFVLKGTKRRVSEMVPVEEYDSVPLYDNIIFLPEI